MWDVADLHNIVADAAVAGDAVGTAHGNSDSPVPVVAAELHMDLLLADSRTGLTVVVEGQTADSGWDTLDPVQS